MIKSEKTTLRKALEIIQQADFSSKKLECKEDIELLAEIRKTCENAEKIGKDVAVSRGFARYKAATRNMSAKAAYVQHYNAFKWNP